MLTGERTSIEIIRSDEGWEKKWFSSAQNKQRAISCLQPIQSQKTWNYGEYTEALKRAMELVAKERLGSAKNYTTDQLLLAMKSLLARDVEEDFHFLEIVVKGAIESGHVMTREAHGLPPEEVILLQAESCLVSECNFDTERRLFQRSRGVIQTEVVPITKFTTEPIVVRPIKMVEEEPVRSATHQVVLTNEKTLDIRIEDIPRERLPLLIQEICMALVEFPETSGHEGTLGGLEGALIKRMATYEQESKVISFEGRRAAEKLLRCRQKLAIVHIAMRDRDRVPVISQAIERARIASIISQRGRRIEAHATQVDSFQKRTLDESNFYIIG